VGGVGRQADIACEVIREFSGRERQILRGVCRWQGGFEQHYKIRAGRDKSRVKVKLR
jgi:hypothetical protein